MTIGILTENKQARYVFKTFFDILGINYTFFPHEEHLLICYDSPINEKDMKSCRALINITKCNQKNPTTTYISNANQEIPIFHSSALDGREGEILYTYKNNKPSILLRQVDDKFVIDIGADIIASAFYLLSRQEEIITKTKDEHRRFQAKDSILYGIGLKRPVVNEYINLLFDLILLLHRKMNIPLLQKWYWPDGKEFAVCLTHDVDVVYKWWIKRILSYLIHFRLKEMISSIGRGEYWTFEELMKIESEYGYRSSFYFLATSKDKFGRRYRIKNRKIRKIIQRLKEGGWEIGLHAGYESFNDKSQLLKEKILLERVTKGDIKGIRQHYLRFDVPTTWRIQEEVDFIYDTTLGYSNIVGCRAGICFPFRPYDALQNSEMKIWEIPLHVMDNALFMSSKDPFRVVKDISKTIKAYHGVLTILWHQNSLDEKDFPGRGVVYKKMISYIKDAYVVPSGELIEWLSKRESFKIVDEKVKDEHSEWVLRAEKDIEGCRHRIFIGNTNSNEWNISIKGTKDYYVKEHEERIDITFPRVLQNNLITIELKKKEGHG